MKDEFFDKSSPCNIEAERSILGAILLDNNVIYQAMELLGNDGKFFYLSKHRVLYSKMVTLAGKDSIIDYVTLSDELRKTGDFEHVGGATDIAALIDGVARTDDISHYVKLIKGKAQLRRLISVARDIEAACYDESEDVDKIIEHAEELVFNVVEDQQEAGPEHVAVTAARLADFYEAKGEDRNKLIGLSTGYPDLDRRTSGLPAGITVVAARPGHGKTSIALNIACNVTNAGGSVYYCSPESSKEQLTQRVLASESRIDSVRMREGRMDRDEWKRLIETLNNLSITKFVIDDDESITPETLLSRTRQYKARAGLDLLVVDYIQLIARHLQTEYPNRFHSLRQSVQYVSRFLMKISRKLKIPVIALAQLGRDVDDRPGHRPILSDLQESSAIEQDAEIVIYLLREEKYEETETNAGILKIIFGKFRDGRTQGDIDMAFIEKYTRTESLYRENE